MSPARDISAPEAVWDRAAKAPRTDTGTAASKAALVEAAETTDGGIYVELLGADGRATLLLSLRAARGNSLAQHERRSPQGGDRRRSGDFASPLARRAGIRPRRSCYGG